LKGRGVDRLLIVMICAAIAVPVGAWLSIGLVLF
jgi:hypothetical protein